MLEHELLNTSFECSNHLKFLSLICNENATLLYLANILDLRTRSEQTYTGSDSGRLGLCRLVYAHGLYAN